MLSIASYIKASSAELLEQMAFKHDSIADLTRKSYAVRLEDPESG
jgi:hypothetical protein